MMEGWVWLLNATKSHYMVDGRSLCGKWAYLGIDYEQRPANNGDCATCRKKHERHTANCSRSGPGGSET